MACLLCVMLNVLCVCVFVLLIIYHCGRMDGDSSWDDDDIQAFRL